LPPVIQLEEMYKEAMQDVFPQCLACKENKHVIIIIMDDSVWNNVGAEHTDMMVECFPGIRAEQLHRVVENRDLGNPETVTIHIGIN
jgi:hypothetical protein